MTVPAVVLRPLGRFGVRGIEHAAGRRQFGFRDWAMPGQARPQHRFALLRKTALKNINVHRCIVEQFGGSMAGRLKGSYYRTEQVGRRESARVPKSFGRTFLFTCLLGLRSRSRFLLVPNLHESGLEIIR